MKPFLAGITGGIGSGKTTVCRIFEIMGVPVYNADNASKQLLEYDPSIVDSVKKLLGKDTFAKDGKPDRPVIAAKVFNDPEKLKQLNAILHPAVRKDFQQWIHQHEHHPLLIKEAAILFESGSNADLDYTITVSAPKEIRIKRVMNRDHKTAEEVQLIMNKQLPQETLEEMSNFVIINDEQTLLIPQILELINRLQNLTKNKSFS